MLFHITAFANLGSIIDSRRLESAATLVAKHSAPETLLSTVRVGAACVSATVTLNDQSPMRGWRKDGLENYLRCLNMYVYFWPCSPLGEYSGREKKKNRSAKHASAYGAKYLAKHEAKWSRVLLATPRDALEFANSTTGPYFSTCNSGAPDRSADLRSLSRTVFSAAREEGVEVVFREGVALADETRVWNRRHSRWERLSRAAVSSELVTAPSA